MTPKLQVRMPIYCRNCGNTFSPPTEREERDVRFSVLHTCPLCGYTPEYMRQRKLVPQEPEQTLTRNW